MGVLTIPGQRSCCGRCRCPLAGGGGPGGMLPRENLRIEYQMVQFHGIRDTNEAMRARLKCLFSAGLMSVHYTVVLGVCRL